MTETWLHRLKIFPSGVNFFHMTLLEFARVRKYNKNFLLSLGGRLRKFSRGHRPISMLAGGESTPVYAWCGAESPRCMAVDLLPPPP